MHFIGLTKEQVREGSTHEDGFYKYILGTEVEVTVLNNKRCNDVMGNVSLSFRADKLMSKYIPINCIFFSESLINTEGLLDVVSYRIDNHGKCIYVGSKGEYNSASGALALSGVLSLNSYISDERRILCTDRMKADLRDKVKVLAVGCRGDSLLGLYYVPSYKGIMVSAGGMDTTYGLSPMTMKVADCRGYAGFTLDYWFTGARIKERGIKNGVGV